MSILFDAFICTAQEVDKSSNEVDLYVRVWEKFIANLPDSSRTYVTITRYGFSSRTQRSHRVARISHKSDAVSALFPADLPHEELIILFSKEDQDRILEYAKLLLI